MARQPSAPPCGVDDPRIRTFGLLLEAHARLPGCSTPTSGQRRHLPADVRGAAAHRPAPTRPHDDVGVGERRGAHDRRRDAAGRPARTAGLVQRVSCPSDRRVTCLSLTEQGTQNLRRSDRAPPRSLDRRFTSRGLGQRDRDHGPRPRPSATAIGMSPRIGSAMVVPVGADGAAGSSPRRGGLRGRSGHMSDPLWTPPDARVAASGLARSARSLGRDVAYPELHRWSVESPREFWAAAWNDLVPSVPLTGPAVIDADYMLGARWFPEVRLNVAERILAGDSDPAAVPADDDVMLVEVDERGRRRELSRRDAVQLTAQWPQRYAPRASGPVIESLRGCPTRRDGAGDARGGLGRCGVLIVLAGLRCRRRVGPLRSDRADGAGGGGRLHLRRAGARLS